MASGLANFHSIVVLTGAGVSAESGLQTFRDQGGLWENQRLEDICTPHAFTRHPERVHAFYNARRAELLTAQPNRAHLALASFEQRFTGDFTLVTQNVDNLHEQAGSRRVLHMHGELFKARCTACQEVFSWNGPIAVDTACPYCKRSGTLRPHIVWFGEMPLFMAEIETALEQCDLFVAIGTSGQVYPAAGFVQLAKAAGAHTVELNLEPSMGASAFAERHLGPATKLVSAFFANQR